MTMSKRLAWKKNRRFGQVFGGRMRVRCADGIFRRLHSIPRVAGSEAPIAIEDNPSRDRWFPLNGSECIAALQQLPVADRAGITHVWLRRPKTRPRRDESSIAYFVCGSGVRAIVLYPMRIDGRMLLGRTKPTAATTRYLSRFGATITATRSGYEATFTAEGMRLHALHVLLHEVGHHVDQQRQPWSKANARRAEAVAEQYAIALGPLGAADALE